MRIGKSIQNERESQGRTKREVVDKCGISETYLCYIEQGKKQPEIPKDEKGLLDIPKSLYFRILTLGLGKSPEEAKDIILDSKLEELGLHDPGLRLFFKDEIRGRLLREAKKAILATYEGIKVVYKENNPPCLETGSELHSQGS
jgi:transcriptional regulator with XRE-family HTH domain